MGIRPYNPEGVQFIDIVESLPDAIGWLVNPVFRILFRSQPRMFSRTVFERVNSEVWEVFG